MERKDMGMNDILPPELIHRIFLRVPAKDLFRLRFVSKLWHSLISDGHFAESHYNLYSAASSHSYYFLVHDYTKACFVQLHTLFDVPAAPTTLKEVSLPPKKNSFLVLVSWDPAEAFFSSTSNHIFLLYGTH
ncbi:Putative F-box only protein [Arachis hypogaea]|nr:Putative F-box only protein [Arachis hypogaea]